MKHDNIECGRTVLETIAVIVVIAILSILAIVPIRNLHSKHIAQVITKEITMVHTNLLLKANKQASDWVLYPFPTSMDYVLWTRFDSVGNAFLKLEGIKKEVCKYLLKETHLFSILTDENDTFTECQSKNNMIVSISKTVPVESNKTSEGTSQEGSDINEIEEELCTQDIDCGNSDRDYCDSDGHCQKCNEGMSYDSTYEECFQVCTVSQRSCDDGTSKWCCSLDLACGRADGNKCMCEITDDCGENYNGYCDHITGRCIECTDDQYIEGTECINKCSGNEDCGTNSECNIPTGKCVSSCASNKYRDEGGNCRGCDDGTRYKPASDYECQKCNITGKRVYYVDEGGYCERSHCERLKFESGSSCQLCGSLSSTTPQNARECFFCDAFLASNEKCQPCSINAAIAAEEANCLMCNDTDFPRQMLNGKCIPACISTQTACQNTAGTNFWCCPQGTECVPEDENVKCRVTSAEGRCRYQFSVTNGNGPYDVIMDDDYSCPDGQYCFGKWDSTGNYLTGWVGDKTDKYIYGVCINMNHTIDSPAKDALNPWISN